MKFIVVVWLLSFGEIIKTRNICLLESQSALYQKNKGDKDQGKVWTPTLQHQVLHSEVWAKPLAEMGKEMFPCLSWINSSTFYNILKP